MTAHRAWTATSLEERRRQFERPQPVKCPTRGCVLRGMSSVDVLPSERPWTPFSASVHALGGRGNRRVKGHLCPVCQAVYEETHVVGRGLRGRALVAALDSEHKIAGAGDPELENAVAWAVSGAKPSRRPWRHLIPNGDLRTALYGKDDTRALIELLETVPEEALCAVLAER